MYGELCTWARAQVGHRYGRRGEEGLPSLLDCDDLFSRPNPAFHVNGVCGRVRTRAEIPGPR